MLQRSIDLAHQVSGDDVIVVLGCYADSLRQQHQHNTCKFLVNEDWSNGMGSSLACASAELASKHNAENGLLVLLADQVDVEIADLQALVAKWLEQPECAVAASHTNTIGPPAIFPARLLESLAGLSGNEGAKAILQREGSQTRTVDMPNAALDIDTVDDLEQHLKAKKSAH